jgi:hypothetical protein
MTILTSDLKLASLIELQTIYSLQDMYDILEIMDAHVTMLEYHRKMAEANTK